MKYPLCTKKRILLWREAGNITQGLVHIEGSNGLLVSYHIDNDIALRDTEQDYCIGISSPAKGYITPRFAFINNMPSRKSTTNIGATTAGKDAVICDICYASSQSSFYVKVIPVDIEYLGAAGSITPSNPLFFRIMTSNGTVQLISESTYNNMIENFMDFRYVINKPLSHISSLDGITQTLNNAALIFQLSDNQFNNEILNIYIGLNNTVDTKNFYLIAIPSVLDTTKNMANNLDPIYIEFMYNPAFLTNTDISEASSKANQANLKADQALQKAEQALQSVEDIGGSLEGSYISG